jgi:HSP20 family protein
MSMLTRWEPFRRTRRMHDMLDRLMDESFLEMAPFVARYQTGVPVDLYQTEDEVVVKATMPGMRPEDINISITGEMLTIEGEVKEEYEAGEDNGANYHIRERRYGKFYRSLTIPTPVDVDKASADYKDGILTLTLPKVAETKSKTITIKTK